MSRFYLTARRVVQCVAHKSVAESYCPVLEFPASTCSATTALCAAISYANSWADARAFLWLALSALVHSQKCNKTRDAHSKAAGHQSNYIIRLCPKPRAFRQCGQKYTTFLPSNQPRPFVFTYTSSRAASQNGHIGARSSRTVILNGILFIFSSFVSVQWKVNFFFCRLYALAATYQASNLSGVQR